MAEQIFSTKLQDAFERKTVLASVMIAVAVAVGGLVEIIPLFYLPNTAMCATMAGTDPTCNKTEHKSKDGKTVSMDKIIWNPATSSAKTLNDWKPGDGVRPYKALETAGRAVYIREGCYTCHSQMIRPFRDEKDRYGHFSIAEESMYDHTFQWGSKRTGPDLARVGGKYSDDWHRRHLRYPREVVQESVMPNYFWLENKPVNVAETVATLKVMTKMPFNPVPVKIYTDAYGADYKGAETELSGKTDMDALIAYLQGLGNHVKFEAGVNYRD